MSALELFVRGVLAGIGIAAPVGPVNIFCISRTLTAGRKAGLVAGVGSAVADTLYGAVAAFGISMVIAFLVREQFWIRLAGGFLLVVIGIAYFMKQPGSLEDITPESRQPGLITAFFMTLTNPTTVLSFLAVLAVLGAGRSRPVWLTCVLVGGIFVGSMLWWTLLAAVAGRYRKYFNDRGLVWMNRIGAFAICAFGIVMMLLSRWHQR